jgi:hypothetical protein
MKEQQWVVIEDHTAIIFKQLDEERGRVLLEFKEFTASDLTRLSLIFKPFSAIPPELDANFVRIFDHNSNEVKVLRASDHELLGTRTFGDEDSEITQFHEVGQTARDKMALFVLRNLKLNRNTLYGIDLDLRTNLQWNFVPDSPFSHNTAAYTCPALAHIKPGQQEERLLLAFNDEFLSSCLVMLDKSGNENGKLWHPGHIYEVETLGDKVYCSGAYNCPVPFVNGTNPMERFPRTIWAISEENLYHHNLIGPFPSGEVTDGFVAGWQSKYENAPFDWYYIFDERLDYSPDFKLSVKPEDKFVTLITPLRWEYKFTLDGKYLSMFPLVGHSAAAWHPYRIIPNDETGYFSEWPGNNGK